MPPQSSADQGSGSVGSAGAFAKGKKKKCRKRGRRCSKHRR
jgi:hypothetical protein